MDGGRATRLNHSRETKTGWEGELSDENRAGELEGGEKAVI